MPSPTLEPAERKHLVTPTTLLTVDVEDYFQVESFAKTIDRAQWTEFPSRVEQNTARLVELFSGLGVRGTFFVLGWVAERFPDVVRSIAKEGHEIACHSYWHRRVDTLTPEEFREDTHRAKSVIEDIVGQRITGYRAPTFSISRKSLWALEILSELEFEYDSSIYPILHDVYGMPEWPLQPTRVDLASGSLIEIPPPTVQLFGRQLPYGGGGYLRIAPLGYHLWSLRRVAKSRPAVIYVHPWEIDPEQPRVAAPPLSRFRHYYGLGRLEAKLSRLAGEQPCIPINEYLSSHSVAPLGGDALAAISGIAART